MIYLLGLYHCFQTKEYPNFLNYVRDFCKSHEINSIGEEMNCTALCDAKRDQSTIKMIADELLIPHAYCDPDADFIGIRSWQTLTHDVPQAREKLRTAIKELAVSS